MDHKNNESLVHFLPQKIYVTGIFTFIIIQSFKKNQPKYRNMYLPSHEPYIGTIFTYILIYVHHDVLTYLPLSLCLPIHIKTAKPPQRGTKGLRPFRSRSKCSLKNANEHSWWKKWMAAGSINTGNNLLNWKREKRHPVSNLPVEKGNQSRFKRLTMSRHFTNHSFKTLSWTHESPEFQENEIHR